MCAFACTNGSDTVVYFTFSVAFQLQREYEGTGIQSTQIKLVLK